MCQQNMDQWIEDESLLSMAHAVKLDPEHLGHVAGKKPESYQIQSLKFYTARHGKTEHSMTELPFNQPHKVRRCSIAQSLLTSPTAHHHVDAVRGSRSTQILFRVFHVQSLQHTKSNVILLFSWRKNNQDKLPFSLWISTWPHVAGKKKCSESTHLGATWRHSVVPGVDGSLCLWFSIVQNEPDSFGLSCELVTQNPAVHHSALLTKMQNSVFSVEDASCSLLMWLSTGCAWAYAWIFKEIVWMRSMFHRIKYLNSSLSCSWFMVLGKFRTYKFAPFASSWFREKATCSHTIYQTVKLHRLVTRSRVVRKNSTVGATPHPKLKHPKHTLTTAQLSCSIT